jgi:hypothetical protein
MIYRNHDGSGEVMRVEPANGKVGIGTSSPNANLEIVGNLKVSTSLTASNAKLTGLSLGTATTASFLALDSNNNIVLTSSAGGSGGSNLIVKDEGSNITTAASSLDFVGTGVVASNSGNNVTVTVTQGISYSRRAATATITASVNDRIIGVSASAALDIRLPSAAGYDNGQYFVVKDEAGNCNSFNITIRTSGSETIDGQTSVILESPFAAVNIYANGSSKFFIY